MAFFITLIFLFSRFLTDSLDGVIVAEEICRKPSQCLTILITDHVDVIANVSKLSSPDFLVNVLKVFKI